MIDAAATVRYRCPVTGEALEEVESSFLTGPSRRAVYPLVDGVPVILASAAERTRLVGTDWSKGNDSPTPLDFYNRTSDHDEFCRETLTDIHEAISHSYSEEATPGPALEIGSGKGSLQGVGHPYVALDYSLTALSAYIEPTNQRVCASAEQLPFFDSTFSYLYSVAALEHVVRPDLAFEEIHRVLRPGGVAFLLPAWHCVQYNCEGIPVRPYRDLSTSQKLLKLSLPIRKNLAVKAAASLPGRLVRRARWERRRGPTKLRYGTLRPDYSTFWMSDSDAASRLDSHEGALFFHSRGYKVLSPGPSRAHQLLARHQALLVRKQ